MCDCRTSTRGRLIDRRSGVLELLFENSECGGMCWLVVRSAWLLLSRVSLTSRLLIADHSTLAQSIGCPSLERIGNNAPEVIRYPVGRIFSLPPYPPPCRTTVLHPRALSPPSFLPLPHKC